MLIMKVAVLMRPKDPVSLCVYRDNLMKALSKYGVEFTPFPESGPIPLHCDLIWEPGICMRQIPPVFKSCYGPVVGTIHGVKVFSLSLEELTTGLVDCQRLIQLKEDIIKDWIWFRKKIGAIVAVSNYGAKEAMRAFNLPEEIVHVVYNGIDQNIFTLEGKRTKIEHPYFLVISRLDPIKNLQRILAAYALLPQKLRPDLTIILVPDDEYQFEEFPELDAYIRHEKGIHLIHKILPQEELASWYRGALALVFPSLRETFGMPIIEAMSCGCPVITSNITACAEIAGDAALLVNPRHVTEIAQAMNRLVEDELLRHDLIQKGLKHAEQFTWHRCAEKHLHIFQLAARGNMEIRHDTIT